MKTLLNNDQVSLERNKILYYRNNKLYKITGFLTESAAKAEYNRITCTKVGRPIGTYLRIRPVASVHYNQLIIEL